MVSVNNAAITARPSPYPHIYPHTLTLTLTTETPINRAFQAESEGVRVEKEKKYFYFLFVFLPVFSCCFIAIHDFKMELVSIHLYLLSPSGSLVIYANLQCDLSSCHSFQDSLFLEILLIARNVLIFNTNWGDEMTKETN